MSSYGQKRGAAGAAAAQNDGLVLQKQLPSSQVPRFNPHGVQPEPKPKKPEYQGKPYSPTKIKKTSKLSHEEENKDGAYENMNIEDLLIQAGAEFRNPEKIPGGWLPLDAYDDWAFDSRRPEDWLRKGGVGDIPKEGVGAHGLWQDKDKLCYWRKIRIFKYLAKSQRYEGCWEITKIKCRLARIFIIFDEENPKKFVQRFKHAYQTRIHADALIKYNYYIENMPKHQIPDIDNDQVNRVLGMTQNTKTLRGKSSADTTTLLNEVNVDFAKTMNNIIFDKHLFEKSGNLITGPLHLPARKEKGLAPYYGMIKIPQPKHSFAKTVSKFIFKTLQVKSEVIRAQQEIRKECNDVAEKDIFAPNITKTQTVDEFSQIQTSSTQQTSFYLKETWVNKLKEIIKANHQEQSDQSGAIKSWFNLSETNREAYENGRLKKFLTQCKFVMAETILDMTKRSVKRYVDAVNWFLPISTVIRTSKDVVNIYYSADQIKAMGAAKDKFPLFQVDIELDENNKVVYSNEPEDVTTTIMKIYDQGLLALQEIPLLEQKLMPHLFKSNQKMFLKVPVKPQEQPMPPDKENKKVLPDENTWVYDEFARLRGRVTEAILPLREYLQTFNQYQREYDLDPDAEIAKLKAQAEEGALDTKELQSLVNQHLNDAKRLKEDIPESTVVSMFRVNARVLRDIVASKHTKIANEIIEIIAKIAKQSAEATMKAFEQVNARIEAHPESIEELSMIRDFMENVPNEIVKLQNDILAGMKIYGILEGFQYQFKDDEDYDRQWQLFGSPGDTFEKIEKHRNSLDKSQDQMVGVMVQEQRDFEVKVTELQNNITLFDQYTDINAYEDTAVAARELKTKLDDAVAKAKQFNNREALTAQEETSYDNLKQMVNDFTPFYELWTTTDVWEKSMHSWLNDDFTTIDPTVLEETVDNSIRTLAKNIKVFRQKDLTKIHKIAETMKEKVSEFNPNVPMTTAMLTEGMKDRHWEAISTTVGHNVKPYEGFTLKNILDMNLLKHSEKIVDIGDRASKEYNIECSLKKMKKDWEDVFFSTKPYKKSGTSTVMGFDDAQAFQDEHIILTQAMQFSSFKKPFEEEIEEWNANLLNIGNVIEEWQRCQQNWAYLQPIFDSNDIQRQLPGDSKKFKQVNKRWEEIISNTKADPNVLSACSQELKDGVPLLDAFRSMNNNLEKVQRGLKDYIEEKCAVFARFYFLSQDDLLEILSQTKEVKNVRPHLKKVFENMHDLEFQADLTITAMMSAEGEQVELNNAVNPKDKKVEDWMCEVEDMMFTSVRYVLHQSILDYTEAENRNAWILRHAGMCVLNGSQVHWTKNYETALLEGGMDGVKKFLDSLNSELLDTVTLVRTQITKLQRITLGALIVLDVHARDVIQTLVDENITEITAFEWISQLRYYWEDDDCRVKCIQTDFPYGYEYLGNTGRLVITPLTDKCYMTLMGALKLNLGGAPAGPAGTGKTESTKDLAKALAKQCVVFNCSDGMDHLMIAKFFKGLSAAGAWCCFDEFNRINVEVLSVIAQQLLELFDAKAKNATEIDFAGSHIAMKPTFCVFITMNPGYAGRTELPDNLKALFRPVAMMVPNYGLIAKIMLYSFGYSQADGLSLKITNVFTLSSEQLSSQDHYDYGMRAVRSVINAAGILKAAFPDQPEDQLILRAIRDVNVPKFLKDDLPLFENIIMDLFPGVENPVIDRGILLTAVRQRCKELHIQDIKPFIEKVFQLYDTTTVRHGLMIVGPTGGGKTKCYQVLQGAQSALKGQEAFKKTNVHVLNPKSITMNQLYGAIDPGSGEWVDGIAAKIIGKAASDQTDDKHWVMFDGPVDALWIESMNTVLDDNKKLCLNSGQIIPLSAHMTMMFEVEDLAVASPATVSRCGMVYMEPESIGLGPLVTSWLEVIPEPLRVLRPKQTLPQIAKLFDQYLEPLIRFMRKNCPEPVPTVNNNLAQSCMRILDCYFAPYNDTDSKKVSEEEVEDLEVMLEPLFMFAAIWSIGCTTNAEGRLKFSEKIRDLMGKDNQHRFPNEGTVYDFVYDKTDKQWITWNDIEGKFSIDSKATFAEIIVPTFDSIRMKYIKKLLIENNKNILCPGPTGTGKTVNISNLLNQQLPEEYQTIPMTFSAQTSANQTQDALDERMEKRRKGIYGPTTGKKFCIFVDDLNMPKKEEYGAQPPIELIRQWMDHGGWYDRNTKEKEMRKIIDVIFISAMGFPGGGRAYLTQRVERHYNIITYANLGKESTLMIFKTITDKFLGSFEEEVSKSVEKLCEATQAVYKGVETKLKPTPSKSHYTFNLRDMSKIFQGVCSAHKQTIQTKVDLLRLWVHENTRVFGDRMINRQDQEVLEELMYGETERLFQVTKQVILDRERIIFGDYMNGIEQDVNARSYQIINDLKLMVTKIEEFLEDYNAGSKHPMRLVMFLDACDHVSRICRVLRQPLGNALLLGVGGSGRQSLSRLATFMQNYKSYQIEVIKGYSMRDWRDNLRTVLMQAGVDGKPTSFLFVDTQIINEQMLEDINNILNSGDVPALYKAEDLEPIMAVGKTECARKNLTLNKMNMFQCYLNRVKQNIHLVIAMSPLGEVFRTRLRMFPSLVNCCTLDWFTNWPTEALLNVGTGFVNDNEMDLQEDQESCIEMFKVIHQSVEDKVIEFREVFRRISYVTPTSYLEFLSMYKKILQEKRTENSFARNRLIKGLEVLKDAAIEVDRMQKQLEEDQPILERTQIEVEEKKKDIAAQTVIAEQTSAVVSVEAEVAAKQEAEVSAVKKDADDKLGEALPALASAVAKVKSINVNDFYEMKVVSKPNPAIVMCFKLVCWFTLPGKKPQRPSQENRQYDDEGYFFDLTKNDLLKNPKAFLQKLIDYDKDHMPDELINRVKPFMEDPLMDEKKIGSVSKALVPVKIWIEAMIKYHETLKIVNPMRETAKVMGEKLAVVQAALAEKRAKVDAINKKLKELNDEQDALVAKAAKLEQDLEDCKKKLVRADKMINGLAGEKDRWTDTVKDLTNQKEFITGNCLVAAGMVSYSGPFISQFREQLEQMWRDKMTELGIKCSPGVTMRQILGHDVTIRQWGVAGLPSDNLSIENGIIMFKSRRWPLMIDPQTQAKKFIKRMGEITPDLKLNVCKMSDAGLIRTLELSIQFGQWVLLENIGEELDPALEPVLLQQKIKQGSGYVIKLGERQIAYNDAFKFFMTTTLPNPHYTPETSVKVTILNFSITPVGLEAQMLNLFVQLEMPDLQKKKDAIVEENAASAKILYDGEDNLLAALNAKSVAELLDNDDLINTLAETQQTSAAIAVRQEESKITEKEIDVKREGFRPIAYRSQLLFFCIVDLNIIDPMYQYSLQWFQKLFESSVKNSEQSEDTEKRIEILNDYFTKSLYQNVCRSLFEMHKLLFSFLLCTKILFGDNQIDQQEWRFFLAGPSGQIEDMPNPTNWLDDLEWQQTYKQLYTMDRNLPVFEGIQDYFINFNVKFKKIFDSVNAHEEPMPGDWNTKLNSFQKMILLKTIRPDKISLAIQNYVIEKIGETFVKPPTFKLSECFLDSANTTPLVFVLSTGSDPIAAFKKFVIEQGMDGRYDTISLGSGQDKPAEEKIEKGKQHGNWVLLANCHLCISWMPRLEAIVEQLQSNIHADFRLWLTSAQTPKFPVSILQNSVKMTMEPPSGLRANMLQNYENFDNRSLNDCVYPAQYKKLLFALAFFHAIIQDRRKFGPIGWNIRYEFTNEDLVVCQRQLKIFLDEAANEKAIPFKVLQFLGAEINYGGRVTDDKDVRLIINIIKRYVNAGVLDDDYKLSESGKYVSIKAGSVEDYVQYIEKFDLNPHPEAFGLHENAEITTNQNETRIILENVLSIQPRQSNSGGKTREDVISEISKSIEEQTPPPFDIEEVQEKYPTDYNESMNTVLTQELVRYNRLLVLMKDMLVNVQLALVGEVVMSEELEKMSNSLFDNQVPKAWQPTVGFLSLKPLASWVNELNERIQFLQKWIDGGSPATYWISGFFFPQAFFTGTLQNFARKKQIAIDQLSFDFRVFDDQSPQSVTERPEDGALCYGMYMEGARWNSQTHVLDDSNPKQLYTEFPLTWFLPKHNRKKPDTGVYNCPLYKVLSRSGTLSTTGHSTNFCIMIEVPSREEEEVWIRAGVALFLSLRY